MSPIIFTKTFISCNYNVNSTMSPDCTNFTTNLPCLPFPTSIFPLFIPDAASSFHLVFQLSWFKYNCTCESEDYEHPWENPPLSSALQPRIASFILLDSVHSLSLMLLLLQIIPFHVTSALSITRCASPTMKLTQILLHFLRIVG